MLIDISEKDYKEYFPLSPNPFISEDFINLTKHKVDKIVRLIDSNKKDVAVGLVAGIKDNKLYAPFSAPYGGFHYRYEEIFYDKVYDYVFKLKKYVSDQKMDSLKIVLSPNIYNPTMNAKLVNAFIRLGYSMNAPGIVSSIDLRSFEGKWIKYRVEENCNKAIRNGLSFKKVLDEKSIEEAYSIILSNREDQGRDIYMSLDDLFQVNNVIPVDFFIVRNQAGEGVGSGVFYRGHEKIVQGIFLGDLLSSRKLGTMDFLFQNLYNHYKKMGYDMIDLGKSSTDGVPNIGLVRFKEIHNCISSLRYTFSLSNV